MKFRMTILVVLAVLLTMSLVGFGAKETPSTAESKCLKIGIVSVRTIFKDCKRNTKYRQEITAERDRMEAELEKLSKQIEADKSGLKTLKAGSQDYLSAVKEILDKQASLQAQQEYFKRQADFREQALIESLFKDIIKATAEVAKEKGLDLVLETSEPEMPAASYNELTLTISTHKVLYGAGCDDITDAVLSKVDAMDKNS